MWKSVRGMPCKRHLLALKMEGGTRQRMQAPPEDAKGNKIGSLLEPPLAYSPFTRAASTLFLWVPQLLF